MVKRKLKIFVLLEPDVRKHPEILITSGLIPSDTFNGGKSHVPQVYCCVDCGLKFQPSRAHNNEDIKFLKLDVAKKRQKSAAFLHNFTISLISELILPAKWPTDTVTLIT